VPPGLPRGRGGPRLTDGDQFGPRLAVVFSEPGAPAACKPPRPPGPPDALSRSAERGTFWKASSVGPPVGRPITGQSTAKWRTDGLSAVSVALPRIVNSFTEAMTSMTPRYVRPPAQLVIPRLFSNVDQ